MPKYNFTEFPFLLLRDTSSVLLIDLRTQRVHQLLKKKEICDSAHTNYIYADENLIRGTIELTMFEIDIFGTKI